MLRITLKKSKSILFEGDNYSSNWQKEAKRRGLPNIKTTPEAVEAVTSAAAVKLYSDYKIFNERELEAVYHIDMENFIKQISIEAVITKDMATTMYLPGVVQYLTEITDAIAGVKSALGRTSPAVASLTGLAKKIAIKVAALQTETAKLDTLIAAAETKAAIKAKGKAFGDVKVQCEKVRAVVDELEEYTSDNHWPVPHYRDMLVGL